jgi:hypothetical protein
VVKIERKIKDPMKYYKLLLILALINFSTVFSQEKLIKHTVKKGETITAIAQKYKVDLIQIVAVC